MRPGTHSSHLDSALCAAGLSVKSFKNFPGKQGVQDTDATFDVHLPFSQILHSTKPEPFSFMYRPATHSLHVSTLVCSIEFECLPETQSLQAKPARAPVILMYRPAEHIAHAVVDD